MSTRTLPSCCLLLALSCVATAKDTAVPMADDSSGSPMGISFYLNGGYASSYLFRGMNLGDNWGEARAEAALPLGEHTSFSVGGKYGVADGYDEAQAFASLQQSLGLLTAAIGYRWYGLDADGRQEVGVLLGTQLLGIDWSLGYYYDAGISAHYAEFLGQHTWQWNDWLALRSSAGLSASSAYWSADSGLNNALFRVDLPVSVRTWCTLTPWVAASLALDSIDDVADDEVSGGVNMQLSF